MAGCERHSPSRVEQAPRQGRRGHEHGRAARGAGVGDHRGSGAREEAAGVHAVRGGHAAGAVPGPRGLSSLVWCTLGRQSFPSLRCVYMHGPTSPTLGAWPTCAPEHAPTFVRVGPTWVEFGRIRTTKSAKLRQYLVGFAEVGPPSTKFGPISTEISRKREQIWVFRVRPMGLADFSLLRPNLARNRCFGRPLVSRGGGGSWVVRKLGGVRLCDLRIFGF